MDKDERMTRIEDAAYAVLAEKGFKGASMLAIAKAAKVSNETLYKWYGDKTGLFAVLVKRNAHQVAAELLRVRQAGGADRAALKSVSQTLLAMVTGERAVMLNRAAAGDPTGILGARLTQEGRDRVAPILADLIESVFGPCDDARMRVETFIALLIGDLQIRRAISALPALTEEDVCARTERALAQFRTLYSLPQTR